MAPPYSDENPNREMVEQGLRVAENEKRDAVTDAYENAALSSDEPQAALDDINYSKSGTTAADPELSAMKEESQPG